MLQAAVAVYHVLLKHDPVKYVVMIVDLPRDMFTLFFDKLAGNG